MGPLVPTIIGNEFNLMIALIAGIGFGFVLEQAGFSSTKKLVGLFYGYDFTVLKVFFTAGVTAMIGVLMLGHWGLLDLSLIYINPTFLWSALVGGAIMGLGFVIGGFCPGTSVCAAAIGKLDGLAFVFGTFLGVWFFSETYPAFDKLYTSEAWGPVLINEYLGMSRVVFALLLTAIAMLAFYFTSKIENNVNKVPTEVTLKKRQLYIGSIAFAFVLIISVILIPDSKKRLQNKLNREMADQSVKYPSVSIDKLAYEIANNYYLMNLIDVRSPEAFKVYHLPFAINIPFEQMTERKWATIMNQKNKTNYYIADDQQSAQKAFLLARHLGEAESFILTNTSDDYRKLFTNLLSPGPNADKQTVIDYHFRKKTADDINVLVEALKNSNAPVIVKTSKIKGGC